MSDQTFRPTGLAMVSFGFVHRLPEEVPRAVFLDDASVQIEELSPAYADLTIQRSPEEVAVPKPSPMWFCLQGDLCSLAVSAARYADELGPSLRVYEIIVDGAPSGMSVTPGSAEVQCDIDSERVSIRIKMNPSSGVDMGVHPIEDGRAEIMERERNLTELWRCSRGPSDHLKLVSVDAETCDQLVRCTITDTLRILKASTIREAFSDRAYAWAMSPHLCSLEEFN